VKTERAAAPHGVCILLKGFVWGSWCGFLPKGTRLEKVRVERYRWAGLRFLIPL